MPNNIKPWGKGITLRLTSYQRKLLWDVVDGAADAGACKDGLKPKEQHALQIISEKLLGLRTNDEEEPRHAD